MAVNLAPPGSGSLHAVRGLELGVAMAGNGNGTARSVNPNDPSTWGKVGRNDPCPCGSGKKYKHCHGGFG